MKKTQICLNDIFSSSRLSFKLAINSKVLDAKWLSWVNNSFAGMHGRNADWLEKAVKGILINGNIEKGFEFTEKPVLTQSRLGLGHFSTAALTDLCRIRKPFSQAANTGFYSYPGPRPQTLTAQITWLAWTRSWAAWWSRGWPPWTSPSPGWRSASPRWRRGLTSSTR